MTIREAQMDFNYKIVFHTEDGREVTRLGSGLFYPHDGGFNMEHMLWLMTEEFGRPEKIEISLAFVKVLSSV